MNPSLPGCKEGEDSSSTANVQHSLPSEEMLVVVDHVPVGHRPGPVLDHLLVDGRLGVAAKIVVLHHSFIPEGWVHASGFSPASADAEHYLRSQ